MNASLIRHWWMGGGSTPDASFIPTDVSGLQYWYDASQHTGLADGALCPTIPDFSGLVRNLSNGTAGQQAVYKTNIVNGKPVYRFDGNKLYAINTTNTNFKHQGDSTLFWVINSNTDTESRRLFDSGPILSTANIGRGYGFRTTLATFEDILRGTAGALVYMNTLLAPSPTPKNQWLVLVMRFEQAKTIEESTIEVNNVLKGAATQSGAVGAGSAAAGFWFARADGLAATRFNGDVAEWFAYNRALTDDEIRGLVGGISSNYGL
jgi:hypothetical protein